MCSRARDQLYQFISVSSQYLCMNFSFRNKVRSLYSIHQTHSFLTLLSQFISFQRELHNSSFNFAFLLLLLLSSHVSYIHVCMCRARWPHRLWNRKFIRRFSIKHIYIYETRLCETKRIISRCSQSEAKRGEASE